MKTMRYSEAKRRGLMRYFTGKPCKRGHIAERDTPNRTCVECVRLWKRGNPKMLEYAKKYAREHYELQQKRNYQYRKTEAGIAMLKRCREKHGKKWAAANREWRKNNPDLAKQSRKNWRENNIDFARRIAREYQKERLKTDPAYKLKLYLRTRILKAINGGKKSGSAVKDIGCSFNELITHLEKNFSPKMTWKNHGLFWQVDHVKPLSDFNLTKRKQFLQACHFTNLQPLTIADHRKKTALEATQRRI